ncbi:GNAT family N-acetyltransferase [Streptomyces sp. TRM 70361]|uniref:GNAT family N-acetyltransferase n=1 Tax=Streptomyces sp. TRM 70361 TaxID=3116553 RepID=UPI002E7B664D|nr:GNAT family N-acetyltransferase [Streptomyces sp. TRM 70361]MEE1942924.1 GNAT family N-acetyltransferase [Streptomyces sp. TRM 70361]
MSISIRDNTAENRYEIHDGDRPAGFCAYEITGGRIALTHTETLPEFTGRGMAKRLVTAALDDARRRGLAVLPFCSYVRKVVEQDPGAYLDLVPEQARERFGLPRTGTA